MAQTHIIGISSKVKWYKCVYFKTTSFVHLGTVLNSSSTSYIRYLIWCILHPAQEIIYVTTIQIAYHLIIQSINCSKNWPFHRYCPIRNPIIEMLVMRVALISIDINLNFLFWLNFPLVEKLRERQHSVEAFAIGVVLLVPCLCARS